MIGAHVAGPMIITRSAQAVVALRQVLAYPNGMELDVEAHGRGTSVDLPKRMDNDSLVRMSEDRPYFSIRFADDQTAEEDKDLAKPKRDREPTIRAVRSGHSRGVGGSRDEDIRLTLWISPLPPSGQVTITCTWPRVGIEQVSVLLDGDQILVAAKRAEPLYSNTEP